MITIINRSEPKKTKTCLKYSPLNCDKSPYFSTTAFISESVIIPTLNAERWISQQLDMLLKQTVQAEILMIDSDSTDATLGITFVGGFVILPF